MAFGCANEAFSSGNGHQSGQSAQSILSLAGTTIPNDAGQGRWGRRNEHAVACDAAANVGDLLQLLGQGRGIRIASPRGPELIRACHTASLNHGRFTRSGTRDGRFGQNAA